MEKIEGFNCKKRPNGSGTVIQHKDGRDKPFSPRLKLGKDKYGSPIFDDSLGNFDTYLEALVCLESWLKSRTPLQIDEAKYNRLEILTCFPNTNIPYPLVPVKAKQEIKHKKDKTLYTFKQLFEEMREIQFPNAEERRLERRYHIKPENKYALHHSNNMINAFHHSTELYDYVYRELTATAFEEQIRKCPCGISVKKNLIKLYKCMDKYAYREGIIDKKQAFEINFQFKDSQLQGRPFTAIEASKRTGFTYEEIEFLENIDSNDKRIMFIRDMLLLSCYTGARADEILMIYTADMFLEDRYFIAGEKTANGIGRKIPIHKKADAIIRKYYNKSNTFLFAGERSERISYGVYNNWYNKVFKPIYGDKIGNKTAHCGRHSLEKELRLKGVSEITRNAIMGHSNDSVGADVYDEVGVDEIIVAIDLVTYKKPEILVFKDHSKSSEKTS